MMCQEYGFTPPHETTIASGVRPARALCLFVALLRRYTGGSDFSVTLSSSGPPGFQRELWLNVDERTSILSLYEQSRRCFGALPNREELLVGPITFRWEAPDRQGRLMLLLDGSANGDLQPPFALQGSLLGEHTEERMSFHFRSLWRASRESPDDLVDEIAILSAEEQILVLRELSHSELRPELVRDELLHQLFESQAALRPEQVAVVDRGQRLTYGELDAMANQLAHFLRHRGIGRGSFVAIQLSRGVWCYAAILGILKAGAAYVPLDPDCPKSRVEHVLRDCGARLLMTESAVCRAQGVEGCEHFLVDQQAEELEQFGTGRAGEGDGAAIASDPCYVIYTSGSTGNPKGVEVSHRAVCHLVRAEGLMFGVTSDDRVFQGLSLAFDAAVEEIWLAWFAGAALVVGTKSAVVSGSELATVLAENRVTVLSTVPTLLSLVDDELPSVRLLILGGEACPRQLAARFCRPNRRVVNTYGPTEATVIATAGDLEENHEVTLGRPIPNTHVYILDRHLRPVAMGATGEICISGVGLAEGYRNQPQLTAERFVSNPYGAIDGSPRLYRTGDLARYTPSGDIQYLGRADAQVKLRGHRIELSEIESILMSVPSVAGAAAAVQRDAAGFDQLVAYVVPTRGAKVDADALRSMLRERLPAYMVPSAIDALPELPTMPSGKVDRGRLPSPVSRVRVRTPKIDGTLSQEERTIAQAWSELFGAPVELDSHFFDDLGGHSLLAAQCVSRLRTYPGMGSLSILDVYQNPTVRGLASRLRNPTHKRKSTPTNKPERVSRVTYASCAIGQFIALYAIFGLYSLQWLAPYLAFTTVHMWAQSDPLALLATVTVMLCLPPLMLVNALAFKWLLVGRYAPGRYPLWGSYYFRWWLMNRILSITPIDMLEGTPLLCVYYRLMGARIGHDVHIETSCAHAFDLLCIGDGTSINADADLGGCIVQDNCLCIGAIRVGSNCTIGSRSVLAPDSAVEDHAHLDELSYLPAGATVPKGETWAGSPAARVPSRHHSEKESRTHRSLAAKLGIGLAYAAASLVVPVVFIASIFPGVVFINHLSGLGSMLLHAPLVALSFVLTLSLQILLGKWLILGRVRPGNYELHGWFHFRYWVFNAIMDLSEDFLGGLYSTLYFNPWYRMLGAKVGKYAEMSTLTSASPDLLAVEDGAFLADYSLVGSARICDGHIDLRPTRIGKRTFVGNSAVVPGGTNFGNDGLLGVLSAAPRHQWGIVENGTEWLGSPAFQLPRRAAASEFTEEQTYRPNARLYAQRLLFDAVRVLLPSTCIIAVSTALLMTMLEWSRHHSLLSSVALFPAFYCAYAGLAMLVVVALKWALIGRFQPGERPLWCTFVWRNELVTAMHENLAEPLFNNLLEGSPYAAWFYRMLGVKIGRRVYIGTSCFTEYDLVEIGDDVSLDDDCTLQTHLFEDRVMKMSRIRIESGCTVGPNSVVLYDTCMKTGSVLAGLSLLMKGETLPAHTCWQGSPARARAADDPEAPGAYRAA